MSNLLAGNSWISDTQCKTRVRRKLTGNFTRSRISRAITTVHTVNTSNMAPTMIQPAATAVPEKAMQASVNKPIQNRHEATRRIRIFGSWDDSFNKP